MAFEGIEAVGLGLAQGSPDPTERVDHGIGVVPDARGRGVGTALVRAFLDRARGRGAKTYLASTAVGNRAMRTVFDRLGGGGRRAPPRVPADALSPARCIRNPISANMLHRTHGVARDAPWWWDGAVESKGTW